MGPSDGAGPRRWVGPVHRRCPLCCPGPWCAARTAEGRDLSGASYERVELVEVDLTEVTATGGSWVDCTFRDCRLTGAALLRTALTGCTFSGCDLSGVTATDCKLVGSRFDRCRYDLLRVEGGDWSFTGLPGAGLATGAVHRRADARGGPEPGPSGGLQHPRG